MLQDGLKMPQDVSKIPQDDTNMAPRWPHDAPRWPQRLPLDASTWSITLCSSFFNCLIVSIQDKMEDDDFIMPPLNCQSTKTLQLGALWVVHAPAAASYKSLVNEEKRLRRLFPQQTSTRGSIFMQESDNMNVQHTQGDPPVGHARAPVLYQGHSLAEKTME